MRRAPRYLYLLLIASLLCLSFSVSFNRPSQAAEGDCLYDVEIVDAAASLLDVTIACPTDATSFGFTASQTLRRYARGAGPDSDWQAVVKDGVARINYRYELGRAADETDSIERVKRYGRSVFAVPPAWMPRPNDADRRLRIAVKSPAGADFVSGLPLEEGRYLLSARNVFLAGYMVFGKFDREQITLPAPIFKGPEAPPAKVTVVVLDGKLDMSRANLVKWIEDCARLVSDYWHGFPAERALLAILPTEGRNGIVFGRVIGTGGITMMVQVGEHADPAKLHDDWIMVHEFLHVGGPFVYDGGYWLMEGMATYVEPILRARAGWQKSQDVWAEFARGMAGGVAPLLESGLFGLQGRSVYWSGALFMLMADVEIRKRTGNAKGLDDCLRGVLKAGGNATQRWTVEQTLAACDSAIGLPVVSELATRYAHGKQSLELSGVWRELGVESDGRLAFYRANAPLASIRNAIVAD